ncbi:Probable flavin-containing monooxygenase 1 [Linum grandiflorum]
MAANQIAIIGAGLSGLLACKYALSKNLKPIVFESRNDVGGIWTKTLSTTKLQTPKHKFQFSDFPWPDSVTAEEDHIPSHDEVLDYLRSYSEHFDLNKHIQLNTKVVGINYRGIPEEEMEAWSSWGVEVSSRSSETTEVHQVGFVVLCVGRYSDVPNIPEFETGKGPEVFKGKVMHSMEYSDMGGDKARKLVKGKRVAVVGLQKNALDIAMECSAVNGKENPCKIVYRREYWNLYMSWSFPLAKLFYLNRFSELWFHKPGEGILLGFLATILQPLRWVVCKIVEHNIKQKHQLVKHSMVPKQSFIQDTHSCSVSIVPEKFYEMVDEGSIEFVKAPRFSFCKEGIVVVADGADHQESVGTDIVIFATGFKGEKKLRDVFGSNQFKEIIGGNSSDTVVPLYRSCIAPRIPQLAVMGFSESSSNLFTTEMKCRWLAEFLDGKFKLPEIKEMEEDALRWDQHLKEYSGDNYRRSCIDAVHIWYCDQLCKDMGWNPRRKTGLWAELFEPYGPLDYVTP